VTLSARKAKVQVAHIQRVEAEKGDGGNNKEPGGHALYMEQSGAEGDDWDAEFERF